MIYGIRKLIVRLTKGILRIFGIGITSYSHLSFMQRAIEDDSHHDLVMMQTMKPIDHVIHLDLLEKSKSQLRQDLFVLAETSYMREGFFVEFGATNGIDLSNTYLLESEFGWKGILAEPGRSWERSLRKNRPSASIETSCIWKESNRTLVFNEPTNRHLSTIDAYSNSDLHSESRTGGTRYEVQSISLNELLKKHQAPKSIEYLSIDTEGSEFEILSSFDFSEYSFQIITVEHNFTKQREAIYALLTRNGYRRKYENLSSFDDWYVMS